MGTDYFSMIRKASLDVINFLERTDLDPRCRRMLAEVGGGEAFDEFGEYCRINPRLAMTAYTDFRHTFHRLGYSTDDLTGLEGLGMIIVVAGLFPYVDVDIDSLEDPDYALRVAGSFSRFIRGIGGEANIKGADTPLMLHFMFNHGAGVFDWATEYATLVYRWASVMAKADGTITPTEEDVLAGLMKLKEGTSGNNVRITDGCVYPESQNSSPWEIDVRRPDWFEACTGRGGEAGSFCRDTAIAREKGDEDCANLLPLRVHRKSRNGKDHRGAHRCGDISQPWRSYKGASGGN